MEFLLDVFAWFTDPAHWSGRRGIPYRIAEHVVLSVLSTAIAVAVALPPALWLAHVRKGAFTANALVNVGRAIPSFGMLVVTALVFLYFGASIAFWPVVIALVLLALPPIFTNTYTGIRAVDPAVIESARGMGFTEVEILRRVELPLATPVLLAGVRISFVQVVATATLGAVIAGGGGVGRYILDGFQRGAAGHVEVFSGAVLAILLVIATESLFTAGEGRLLPTGVRRVVETAEVAETAQAGGG